MVTGPLSDQLRAFVDATGPVAHLVSPNKLHHLYLGEWHRVWPDAALWGPASTRRKRMDLTFFGTLTDTPPNAWASTIDQSWMRDS